MTGVLIWRGEDTEEKGWVKTEAKAGVIRPQAEACWQLTGSWREISKFTFGASRRNQRC